MKKTATQRITTLIFLTLIFFIPCFAAWYVYQHPHHWLRKTTNHGTFITPMIPIQQISLHLPQGKWHLLYVAEHTCPTTCLARLHDMKQIQLALHTKSTYLQNWIITPTQFDKNVLMRFPLIRQNILETTVLKPGFLYVVDPYGNLMMHYSERSSSTAVYKDLNRLIRT